MNWKRGFGFGFIFIGLFFTLSGKIITGAIIGFKPENYIAWLGIMLFFIGFILLFFGRKPKEVIYHGTCKAFVELANERGGQFGPDYDRVSFTPDYDHAKMYAESWKTPGGKKRLREYFGNIPKKYLEPVILEFDKTKLGDLEKTLDGSAVELSVKKGPVKLPS